MDNSNKVLKRRKYLSENVARFFIGPQGSAALKALEELYCTSSLFDEDPLKMTRNVTEHDLIQELKRVCEETN